MSTAKFFQRLAGNAWWITYGFFVARIHYGIGSTSGNLFMLLAAVLVASVVWTLAVIAESIIIDHSAPSPSTEAEG